MMARWWLVEQQQIFNMVTYLLTYKGTLKNTYDVNNNSHLSWAYRCWSSNGCKLTQGIENIDLSLSHSGFHIQFSPQFWSTRLEQTLSAKLPVVESLIQVLTSHSTVATFIIISLFKIINACCGSAINARKDVFAKARCHISHQLFARMDLIKGRGIILNLC